MTVAAQASEHAQQTRQRPTLDDLRRTSAEARKLIVQAIHHAGAGHLGGPLSATDLLTALYFDQMNVNPADPAWAVRDRFILSKGHSSIALYTILAMRGYFPVAELNTFDAAHSRLQGHPDMHALPGLEMSTGSLGQGLSPGAGMALGARLRGQSFHTWVMLGDGELQEGQIWEAAFWAARYRLDNLTAILDYNGLPQFGWPEPNGFTRETPIGDPGAKFRAFGWHVVDCDGHDQASIRTALDAAKAFQGQPTCVVAHTVKGKGVSFMEGDFNWHAKVPTDEQLAAALAELDAQIAAIGADNGHDKGGPA
jgi:transketolase